MEVVIVVLHQNLLFLTYNYLVTFKLSEVRIVPVIKLFNKNLFCSLIISSFLSNSSISLSAVVKIFAIAFCSFIDFGIFITQDGSPYVKKHVFFVGKIFVDDYGTDVFINLFSLVFES